MTALMEINPTPEQLLPELKFENQQITCSSLDISNHFEKQHKDVLRAIRNLECSQEFTERNFAPSEYTDPTGRKLESFKITRDGFTFLAMGFTGKKAAAWKEAYINAFNQMEKRLQHIFNPAVIEYRQVQINQIERLVDRIMMMNAPDMWDLRESLKTLVLQFTREVLMACDDQLLIQDRKKALQELGITLLEQKKVEHPTITLFWEQVEQIGLPLLNRSTEQGLMAISPRWYMHWVKQLGLKPVLPEQELNNILKGCITFPYLGKQYRKGKKPEICWYFAHPLNSPYVSRQNELSADDYRALHKGKIQESQQEGEDA